MCCVKQLSEPERRYRGVTPLKPNHCVQPFTFKFSPLRLPVDQPCSVSPHNTRTVYFGEPAPPPNSSKTPPPPPLPAVLFFFCSKSLKVIETFSLCWTNDLSVHTIRTVNITRQDSIQGLREKERG